MNYYIVSGIILTAIGTLLLTYGGLVQSQKDSDSNQKKADEQYHQISKDLSELKGIPKAELSYDAVRKVEIDVQNWAQSFVSDKDRLQSIQHSKIEQENRRLQSIERLSRDYFGFFTETLRQAINSYNQNLKTNIAIQLPELDPSLFGSKDSRFDGNITFPSGRRWIITACQTEPGPEIAAPIILINKFSSASTVGQTELLLRFGKDMKRFHIRLQGDFSLFYGTGTVGGEISDYENSIKAVLRNLLEAEIIATK